MKLKPISYLLTLSTLLLLQMPSTALTRSWHKIRGGCAKDVAMANNNVLWIIDCTPGANGGFAIYTGNIIGQTATWTKVTGAGVAIAVAPEGNVWVVAGDGSIWNLKASTGQWKKLPGCAKDIGVGKNDSAWVIGCTSDGNGNYNVHRWNGSAWQTVGATGYRIAVSPEGIPWKVKYDGSISRRSGNTWESLSGCGKDIGVGGNNNDVWVLGCNSGGSGGYEIYRKNGDTWEYMEGAASRISVSSDDLIGVVTADGSVWYW